MISLVFALSCTHEVEPHSVVVILADDLGIDALSTYGAHPRAPQTPTLSALAAEGVLFRQAYVYPLCSPTRASMLTGRFGLRTGVGKIVEPQHTYDLPLSEVTIPEMLPEEWSSGIAGKWHLAKGETYDNPREQGFDTHRGSFGNIADYQDWTKLVDGVPERTTTHATVDTIDEAIHLATTLSPPYFLYVSLNAPHGPWHFPPGYPRKPGAKADYDAMVEHMDAEIGRLLEHVDLDDTTVVFLGDNGSPPSKIRGYGPKEAKKSVFEGGIKVPLIVAGPSVGSPGETTQALAVGADVFSTVAEIAGVEPEGTIDGVSLLPVLAQPSLQGERRYAWSARFQPNGFEPRHRWYAIRDGRYKLWRYVGADSSDVLEEHFYDLDGVIREGDDLLAAGLSGEQQASYETLVGAATTLLAGGELPRWPRKEGKVVPLAAYVAGGIGLGAMGIGLVGLVTRRRRGAPDAAPNSAART